MTEKDSPSTNNTDALTKQLMRLAKELEPLIILSTGIIAIGAAGAYGRKRLRQLSDDRIVIRERQLRIALRKLGLRVSPVGNLSHESALWSHLAQLEEMGTANLSLRRQRFRRINDDVGPGSYHDPEWYFVTTHHGKKDQKPIIIGATRYIVTGEIDFKNLGNYKHADIEKMAEHRFGRTMVIEASVGNPNVRSDNSEVQLSADIINAANYLAALDYTRQFDLALLTAEPQTARFGEQKSAIESFRTRYLIGTNDELVSSWRRLAVITRFGNGTDPDIIADNYYSLEGTQPGVPTGWVILRDPTRDDRTVNHGVPIFKP